MRAGTIGHRSGVELRIIHNLAVDFVSWLKTWTILTLEEDTEQFLGFLKEDLNQCQRNAMSI
jgi:hypothetical protein